MTLPSRLLSVVGILVFVSGQGGSGKILVLSRMLGFCLISFLLLRVVEDLVTKSSRILGILILLMLSSAKIGCLFSVGLVILSSLLISSWILLDISCLRNFCFIFLGSCVCTCKRLLGSKVYCWRIRWVGLERA